MTAAQPRPAKKTPSATKRRANRANAMARFRPADDPELVELQVAIKRDALEEHIRRVVDQAPPLTDEQCARLAELLRPGLAETPGAA